MKRGHGNVDVLSSLQDLKSNVVHSVLKKPRLTNNKYAYFGRWLKGEMMGSGAYGCVYKGMGKDHKLVAMKEVSLHEDGGGKAIEAIRQLKHEIAMLSKIHHPNVIGYLGSERDGEKMCMILELATKGSLKNIYEKNELLDEDIKRYTKQIVCGLKHLHDQNIVHRDIKCANVLMNSHDEAKIADFGIAQQVVDGSSLDEFVGSAHWMAPEVVSPKKSYNVMADIWSLGCTVLEMAVRRPPFGANLGCARVYFKLMNGVGPCVPDSLPEDMKHFISKCLQVEVSHRATCEELLAHPFLDC